jgi:hypothetical protein
MACDAILIWDSIFATMTQVSTLAPYVISASTDAGGMEWRIPSKCQWTHTICVSSRGIARVTSGKHPIIVRDFLYVCSDLSRLITVLSWIGRPTESRSYFVCGRSWVQIFVYKFSILTDNRMGMGSHGWMMLTGESEELGEKPAQWHFSHHKSHMNWPGRTLEPPRWEADD